MLVSRQWANCSVELLWHRPSFDEFIKYQTMVAAIQNENACYKYAQLIKRLNLTTIAGKVSDGSMKPLVHCTKLERLTLTNCTNLSDTPLMEIFASNPRIQALDLSQLHSITDISLKVVAERCPRLQGLNIAGCKRVTDASLVPLSENCKFLRRVINIAPLILSVLKLTLNPSLNSTNATSSQMRQSYHWPRIAPNSSKLISTNATTSQTKP